MRKVNLDIVKICTMSILRRNCTRVYRDSLQSSQASVIRNSNHSKTPYNFNGSMSVISDDTKYYSHSGSFSFLYPVSHYDFAIFNFLRDEFAIVFVRRSFQKLAIATSEWLNRQVCMRLCGQDFYRFFPDLNFSWVFLP